MYPNIFSDMMEFIFCKTFLSPFHSKFCCFAADHLFTPRFWSFSSVWTREQSFCFYKLWVFGKPLPGKQIHRCSLCHCQTNMFNPQVAFLVSTVMEPLPMYSFFEVTHYWTNKALRWLTTELIKLDTTCFTRRGGGSQWSDVQSTGLRRTSWQGGQDCMPWTGSPSSFCVHTLHTLICD